MARLPYFVHTIALFNILSSLDVSHAVPTASNAQSRWPSRTLYSRQDNQNPWDQSWIAKWAAIGDSYAAGIGSGTVMDKDCSRYSESYPQFIETDPDMGEWLDREFTYRPCSGATSKEVLEKQLPQVSEGQDVITLSAGGNDVGLVDVLNWCVYQWDAPLDQCGDVLAATSVKIERDLAANLRRLLDETKKKLSSRGTIYVTGYAKFWGESEQCNDVTWSFWNLRPNKVYLTLEHRKEMNKLVERVNGVIDEVVRAAGSQVVFVEYDYLFGMMRGRFCESGVIEPSPNRELNLFYQMDTTGNDGNLEEPAQVLFAAQQPAQFPEGTFEGTIQQWVDKTQKEHPDWEPTRPLDSITKVPPQPNQGTEVPDPGSINTNPTALPVAQPSVTAVPAKLERRALIGDDKKRVFHPKPIAHQIIAQQIMWKMAHRRAEMLGLPREDRQQGEVGEITTCPANQHIPEPPSDTPPDAPKCSQCSQGGGEANIGVCWGGDFDGKVCCGDNPFVCTQTGCNGVNGKCQGQYQGCDCTDPQTPPPEPAPEPPAPMCSEPTDGWTCGAKCAGNIPCTDWCNANCAHCFPVC